MAAKKTLKRSNVSVQRDAFVLEIMSNLPEGENVKMLKGFVGNSSTEGYLRLYTNILLKDYIDIPESAVLYSVPMDKEESPLGGSLIWIVGNAEIILSGGHSAVQQATEGQLLEAFRAAQPPETVVCTSQKTCTNTKTCDINSFGYHTERCPTYNCPETFYCSNKCNYTYDCTTDCTEWCTKHCTAGHCTEGSVCGAVTAKENCNETRVCKTRFCGGRMEARYSQSDLCYDPTDLCTEVKCTSYKCTTSECTAGSCTDWCTKHCTIGHCTKGSVCDAVSARPDCNTTKRICPKGGNMFSGGGATFNPYDC